MSDIQSLNPWVNSMLRSLDSAERARLFRHIAIDLRNANKKRMTAQIAPDGTPWTKRKKRDGKVKKARKMMRGLRKNRYFKIQSSPNHVRIGWDGNTGRIARIHHYGLRERLGGKNVQHPKRELLGLNGDDMQMIEARILNHIQPKS